MGSAESGSVLKALFFYPQYSNFKTCSIPLCFTMEMESGKDDSKQWESNWLQIIQKSSLRPAGVLKVLADVTASPLSAISANP